MLRNYFKIAWRNLLRNKVSSFINIIGLAVGMAVAMLIGLWIYDELTFDAYHDNYERIAQVMQHQTYNGNVNTSKDIPIPLEKALHNIYDTDFKYISLASYTTDHILSVGEKKISKTGNFVQKDFPEMLTLKMLYGTRSGLERPNSILISESTARALFGASNPLDKILKIDNSLTVTVTGVYQDLPYNSHFKELEFIAPWDLYFSSQEWVQEAAKSWGNASFQLFVQITSSANMKLVSEKINPVMAQGHPGMVKFNPEVFLHPMNKWHLYSEFRDGANVGGRIQYVWLFGIVAGFVLLLACFNFMNLSTARSEKRAKEVGIRKTLGSVHPQLVGQFLSESVLTVVFGFMLAIVLAELLLPWFNSIADKKIIILWTNPWFWLACLAFVLLTALLAGSYPALYLSSFQPGKVLKGTFRTGNLAIIPRKVLVVLQFIVSVTLIIGTIVVYHQIQFTKNRPMGYNKEGLITIQKKSPDFYGKLSILSEALKQTGAIVEISESSSPITGISSYNGGIEWQGKDPNLEIEFATVWITPDFGKTIDWQILEGRDFSKAFSDDPSKVIINEAAVKFMGIENPLGMSIKWGHEELQIIGIIKDMITLSPHQPAVQTIYLLNPEYGQWINLKLNPHKSASESLALIKAVFNKIIPSAPFEYSFIDDAYAAKFAAEERIGKLASFFAILAIFISCLGLFGLASFVAEQRTKEIGIRKVLGASILNLWSLLSKEFLILVMISLLIASPLAYYIMNNWIQDYTYRADISWWIFASAGAGALLIALLTVSFQAIRAAVANPVESLKNE